jgi:hypothetical protein
MSLTAAVHCPLSTTHCARGAIHCAKRAIAKEIFMVRKALVLGSVLLVCTGSLAAQGLYFDIGLGAGPAWTEIDGYDMAGAFGGDVDDLGADVGLKAGYGPVAGKPLYIVGEIAGHGHRFYDSSNYIQFNSYIAGAGVIYYPVPLLQLAAGVGVSWVANTTDLDIGPMNESDGGFAGTVSVAVDLGGDNHGCLLGVRYFVAVNTLEISGAEQKQSGLSFFVRYAFRQKE